MISFQSLGAETRGLTFRKRVFCSELIFSTMLFDFVLCANQPFGANRIYCFTISKRSFFRKTERQRERAFSEMPPKVKKNDASHNKDAGHSDLKVAFARIAYLEAENARLTAEKAAMAKRVEEVRKSIQDKLENIQAGIRERLNRGESDSSIMSYVKAGFGTMFGVLAALAVVDLAVGAFDEIGDGFDGSNGMNASSGVGDGMDGTAGMGDGMDASAGMGDGMDFGFGGGAGRSSSKKVQPSKSVTRTKKDKRSSRSPARRTSRTKTTTSSPGKNAGKNKNKSKHTTK